MYRRRRRRRSVRERDEPSKSKIYTVLFLLLLLLLSSFGFLTSLHSLSRALETGFFLVYHGTTPILTRFFWHTINQSSTSHPSQLHSAKSLKVLTETYFKYRRGPRMEEEPYRHGITRCHRHRGGCGGRRRP